MLIVTRAYNDYSADVVDTRNFRTEHLDEEALTMKSMKDTVYGVVLNNDYIEYIVAYECHIIPNEDEERLEQLIENKYKYIRGTDSTIVLKEKKEKPKEVKYYVATKVGDSITYLGKNKSYTGTKYGAETFTKDMARQLATTMSRRSRTGKYWYAGVV